MEFTEEDIAQLVSQLSLHKNNFQQRSSEFSSKQLYEQRQTFDNFNSKPFSYKLYKPQTDDIE